MRDGRYVVLCIDDEAGILDSLRCIVEAGGYVFEGASSAATVQTSCSWIS